MVHTIVMEIKYPKKGIYKGKNKVGEVEVELTPEQKQYYEMGFMCGYIERLRINKEEADEQFNNKPRFVK